MVVTKKLHLSEMMILGDRNCARQSRSYSSFLTWSLVFFKVVHTVCLLIVEHAYIVDKLGVYRSSSDEYYVIKLYWGESDEAYLDKV